MTGNKQVILLECLECGKRYDEACEAETCYENHFKYIPEKKANKE
jgi:hypothetical protein